MSIDQPIQFLPFYPKQFRTKCKINQTTLSVPNGMKQDYSNHWLERKKEKRKEKKNEEKREENHYIIYEGGRN